MARKLLALGENGTLVVRGRDGSSQPITERPPTSAVPHVAYLLVDCSDSMSESLPEAVAGASKFFRDAMEKRYHVGLIRFSSDASLSLNPTRDLSAMESALRSLSVDGSTNMTGAIDLAAHCLSIGTFPRAMVVVTDGCPDNEATALAAADRARKAGIDIIAIGTGGANQTFLSALASRSDLGVKVARQQLAETISSAARLLPR